MHYITSFWIDEDGVVAAEYALILALIAVAAIVSLGAVGQEVCHIVDAVNEQGFGRG